MLASKPVSAVSRSASRLALKRAAPAASSVLRPIFSLAASQSPFASTLNASSDLFFPSRSFSANITRRPPPKADKVYATAAEAVAASGLKSGQTLLVGGFGLCGVPFGLIDAVAEKKAEISGLTCVSNNCGVDHDGLGILLQTRQAKRMISSYVGENHEFARQYMTGELEVELTPQGTLAERLRAAGAGIPAFFSHTSVGTSVQTGTFTIKYGPNGSTAVASKPKETREFNGKKYVMEEALHADVAIVKAYKADTYGNLIFRGTAQNFNPDMAMAAKYTIAEVEEIVPAGAIRPEEVHLPGVFVKAIVKTGARKILEKETYTDAFGKSHVGSSTTPHSEEFRQKRERIVRRAALELKDGMNVNLGIGMPTLASNYIKPGVRVMFQSENGLLGMGPYPRKEMMDADLVNAGKESVTAVPGGSVFSSSTSFAMIRGGHLDCSILGAMEVNEFGDLANWIVPGKIVKGMGGAMDLVASGSYIVVAMEHCQKGVKPKILKKCSLPITGLNVVNRIITDLAVFDVCPKTGLTLVEIAEGTSVEDLKKVTEPDFKVSPNLKTIEYA